jgi:hypothetical protein
MRTANEWCHNIICGVGGLKDFIKYEGAYYHGCPKETGKHDNKLCWAAAWAIQCLFHPKHYKILTAIAKEAGYELRPRSMPGGAE